MTALAALRVVRAVRRTRCLVFLRAAEALREGDLRARFLARFRTGLLADTFFPARPGFRVGDGFRVAARFVLIFLVAISFTIPYTLASPPWRR